MSISYGHFRLIHTPCCGTLLCWINPRLPNYCPECGQYVFNKVKSCVVVSDPQAHIKFKKGGVVSNADDLTQAN